jgi:hypothetical protein
VIKQSCRRLDVAISVLVGNLTHKCCITWGPKTVKWRAFCTAAAVPQADHAINDGRKPRFGLFLEATAINWSTPSSAGLRLAGQKSGAMRTIIPKDFDFVKLGIGGLNNEFNQVRTLESVIGYGP